MRLAYLDCFSGLSGDMFLGALIDAGLEPDALRAALAKLPIGGYSLSFTRVRRGPLSASRVGVEVAATAQPARRGADLLAVLEQSTLPGEVVVRSKVVIQRLIAAEARVHGMAPGEVHLHELGAVDALVDVVGTVSGLALLGIEELWVSPLPCPRGWVQAAHGPLPLPAPAVTELLSGVPVYGVEDQCELVTPTGAALAVSLAAGFGLMPPMRLLRVGYGAGSRELGHPNVVRLILGEGRGAGAVEQGDGCLQSDLVAVVETSIDDMNAEFYPYVAERLREAGALDVYWTAVQMKKGRPGVQLKILLPPAVLEGVARVLFAETTTLGLRWRLESRWVASRDWLQVEVAGKVIRVKYSARPCVEGQPVWQVAPEYEDCRSAAAELGLPLPEVYLLAQEQARQTLQGGAG